MKVTLIIAVSLLLLVAAMALPVFDGPGGGATPCPCREAPGRVLESGEASGELCRLVVEGGPETTVDRGSLAKVGGRCVLVGRYRYWDEPQGRTLYVYDDVQDLVGRIVNPRSVRIEQVGVR